MHNYSLYRPERRTASVFPLTTLEFPHYSTGNQKFFLDQTLAFVGLVFLEGREAVAKIAVGRSR